MCLYICFYFLIIKKIQNYVSNCTRSRFDIECSLNTKKEFRLLSKPEGDVVRLTVFSLHHREPELMRLV